MLMTDDAPYYRSIGWDLKYNFTMEHGIGEYVRGGTHTNTIDGFTASSNEGWPASIDVILLDYTGRAYTNLACRL
jgi:hypothetical protein